MSSEISAFRCKAGLFKVGVFKLYTSTIDLLTPVPEATSYLFYWSVPGEKWVPLGPHSDFCEFPVGIPDDYLLPVEMAMLDAISARHGGYVHKEPEPKETA